MVHGDSPFIAVFTVSALVPVPRAESRVDLDKVIGSPAVDVVVSQVGLTVLRWTDEVHCYLDTVVVTTAAFGRTVPAAACGWQQKPYYRTSLETV